jgi:omega-6 fatty acid desaturase (delta-12 desaturase)
MFVTCRVEFLCHDISVHVPHHVNAKIPWYNLRAATDSLREVRL